MASIEFCGVSRVFTDGTKGLYRLDIFVRPGELLVVVGPSGSGKTTLLRLLAGLDSPTSGKILLGEENGSAADLQMVSPQGRNVALVSQGLGLYSHLSAEENIAFGWKASQGWWESLRPAWGTKPAPLVSMVNEIAKRLGIEKLLQRKPAELSGGEQQRVALARALVRRPKMLLLDEPFSDLDAGTRLRLQQEVRQLQRELNVTTLWVTHDQTEALAIADRIAVLSGGMLRQVATPAEVYQQPADVEVAGMFGFRGMNLWRGKIVEESGSAGQNAVGAGSKKWTAAGLSFVLPSDLQESVVVGSEVVVGFRPEAVRLLPSSTSELSPTVKNRFFGKVLDRVWRGDVTLWQVEAGQSSDSSVQSLTMWYSVANLIDLTQQNANAFSVDESQLVWFQAKTGKNLRTVVTPIGGADSSVGK